MDRVWVRVQLDRDFKQRLFACLASQGVKFSDWVRREADNYIAVTEAKNLTEQKEESDELAELRRILSG